MPRAEGGTPDAAPVLVVGGGVAGLVLARRLALAGRAVTVLEAADRVGGQLEPLEIAGVRLDAGAESFATRGGAVATLLAELGLSADVVAPTPAPAWVYRPRGHGGAGSAVPLPAVGFLGIPGDAGAADVVRALGRPAALRARLDRLLPRGMGSRATTVGELVGVRMGRAVVDTLVSPVTRGVYSTDARDLPLATAAPQLLQLLRENGCLAGAVQGLRAAAPAGTLVGGLRGGVFRLAEALAADCARLGVTIETGVRVDDVLRDHVGVGGQRREGEVVLAAARPGVGGGRAITLVTLVVDSPALDGAPRGTGLLVAPGAGVVARALTHLSAKWGWVAEALPGRHALRLSYDAAPADPIATALADASRLFGTRLDAAVDADVRTWKRPAPDPGESDVARVGESVAGTGLAAIVAHAEAVASRIAPIRAP